MDQKVIDKIRKLFALASSPSEAEAQSAYAKAHELLKQYNLTVGDIKAEDEKSQVQGVKTDEGTHLPGWCMTLLGVVARANYCAPLFFHRPATNGQWSTQHYHVMVYGREHNVQTTMVMYEYLRLCVVRAERKAREEIVGYRRKDFQMAMVSRLNERIEAEARAESSCTALVVLSTEAQDALRRENPNTRHMKAYRPQYSESYARGLRAADGVSLNRQVGGSRSAEQIS